MSRSGSSLGSSSSSPIKASSSSLEAFLTGDPSSLGHLDVGIGVSESGSFISLDRPIEVVPVMAHLHSSWSALIGSLVRVSSWIEVSAEEGRMSRSVCIGPLFSLVGGASMCQATFQPLRGFDPEENLVKKKQSEHPCSLGSQ